MAKIQAPAWPATYRIVPLCACGRHRRRGDSEEADESVEHQPVVTSAEACICLVALEGLRFSGLVGALLNPFTR
jgi:anti-sigma factor ChrR (cupin superfamily)